MAKQELESVTACGRKATTQLWLRREPRNCIRVISQRCAILGRKRAVVAASSRHRVMSRLGQEQHFPYEPTPIKWLLSILLGDKGEGLDTWMWGDRGKQKTSRQLPHPAPASHSVIPTIRRGVLESPSYRILGSSPHKQSEGENNKDDHDRVAECRIALETSCLYIAFVAGSRVWISVARTGVLADRKLLIQAELLCAAQTGLCWICRPVERQDGVV